MTIRLGLEVFLEETVGEVAGKRLGLVACPSSVDRELRSSVERLYRHPAIDLVALFGPEHGLRGEAQAGVPVATYKDALTGLPVHSLYGDARRPSPDMLRGIDAIIIDLQDGGLRFYTFLATALYVMEAAAAAGCKVILLDRPAPITGSRIEGPMLDADFASFVGPYPMPIRYGMTIGEMAQMANSEHGINCDLTVIAMQGWERNMWFDDTGLPFVPSSPNLPTLDTMTLYPGACLIEGSNLSEGRGSTKPFEYIGAPWIDALQLADQLNDLDLKGARFRPVYFVPTFSKYRGELCAGVHIHVTDRERFLPVAMILNLLQTVIASYPEDFAWRAPWAAGSKAPIDLLSGGTSVREHLNARRPVEELIASWRPGIVEFLRTRQGYLLY
ncbi:MAG: DUF1343 domain-containing protein [Chloroflexi bacterium]|nr:DUF1343 domain-containing protein [Chloroflexota bacterium]